MATTDPFLKTQEVAQALGVSVSTIKRWVDAGAIEASKTVGRHRLIRLSEALKFANRQKLPHDGLALFGGDVAARVLRIDDRAHHDLLQSLRHGASSRARQIIGEAFDAGFGASAVGDQLIRPVMERLGHGWEAGVIDVYQEHEATEIVSAALREQVERTSCDERGAAPLALGAAPEGDPYSLALMLGELVLREAGWNVRNLGTNLPLQSLGWAVRDHRPRLVFLSVNHLASPTRFARDYLKFSQTAAARGVAVMLGGRALDPELRGQLVAACFGERLAHLEEFARRLFPSSDGSARGIQPGTADTSNG